VSVHAGNHTMVFPTPAYDVTGDRGRCERAIRERVALYALDHENRIWSWGLVTTRDVQDYFSRLMTDPRFESDYRCLHDMHDATAIAIDTEDLIESAMAPVFCPGARRAVVAPRDAVYRVARAYAVSTPEQDSVCARSEPGRRPKRGSSRARQSRSPPIA
jgi:hypothetical protein